MDLGRRIQELRRGQRLSQEKLAEQMEVSRQAISKWESGAAIPEVDKLIQLARFFGVTVDELLGVRPPEVSRQSFPMGEQAPGLAPEPPEEMETPRPPTQEERLHALEGMVAALGEDRRRNGLRKKWVDALLLAVTLAALVFAAGFSVYHTRMTRWQLQNLQVDLERLNVEVINLKYKDPLLYDPAPGEEAAAGLLADWDISFQDYDLEQKTISCRLFATPKSLREGMTGEFILARKDGPAVSLPAEVVAGAMFQAVADIPWEGETTVSLSLLDGETGERNLCLLGTLRSPGDNLRLHTTALYSGSTSFPEGKVSFQGTVQWECWYHSGEVGIPVKNYAVSARAAVYIDGAETEAFPFDLNGPEDQGNLLHLRLPLVGEYPLGPNQRLELVVETTDALGQEYREVLAAYAAGENGIIDLVG